MKNITTEIRDTLTLSRISSVNPLVKDVRFSSNSEPSYEHIRERFLRQSEQYLRSSDKN